jgi:hypothetical protein
MFGRTFSRLRPHLPRFINPLGYQGDIHQRYQLTPEKLGAEARYATQAALKGENLLLTGCSGTGKFSLLNYIADILENPDQAKLFLDSSAAGGGGKAGAGSKGVVPKPKAKTVARTSLLFRNAFRMEGLLLHSFVGLRHKSGEELPGFDQMVAAFERHVRLMSDAYAGIFPSLATADVLLLDSLQLLSAEFISAIDAVARTVRNRKDVPFGGMQVIASADFWMSPVHPASPNDGYVFQDPRFSQEWFPKSNQVLLKTIFRHKGSKRFTELTNSAHMGNLKTADIKELVEMCRNTNIKGIPPTTLMDNRLGGFHANPRFARQPSRITPPEHSASLRRLQFGHYMLSTLHSGFYCASYGLQDRLNVDLGTVIEIIIPSKHLPKGSLGIVVALSGEGRITVEFPELERTETISQFQVIGQHPDYPQIEIKLNGFPFISRSAIYPQLLLSNGDARHYILDARLLTDTNDLGNILASTSGPKSLSIVPKTIEEYLKRDGIVNDPIKIYYEELTGQIEKYPERWCRNCKNHFPGKEFMEHWGRCIREVRWCSDCNMAIETSKWEPHCEKHTIVMCIDCGTALEWRDWETHRLTCTPMLRELTSDNVMLPATTRDSAMSSGHDRRDLQTVEKISKSRLPKSHLDVIKRRKPNA